MDDYIPQCVPNVSGREREYLNECIDSTYVSSLGKFVNNFESSICQITGFEFCEAVSSGTNGLHLGLHALGVKKDDLVIIPTYTFIATANAISHCGAEPWLFDIDQETLNLDLKLVSHSLREECYFKDKQYFHKKTNQRIGAIMPVLCLGYPLDLGEIKKFRSEFSIPIIFDSAAALGSTFDNLNLGEYDVDISVLSFNGNKTFTTGGGGAVLTNNEEIFKKINHTSTTARVGKEYIHDEVGFNYRMTNIQAALGVAQLERYNEFVQKKKDIQETYVKNIKVKGISYKQYGNKSIDSVRWLSHMYLDSSSEYEAAEIFNHLTAHNIESRSFWVPMHMQPPYKNSISSLKGISEKVYGNIVILPSSTNIKDEELKKVVDVINMLS